MIQRIQSIYLLIVAGLSVAVLLFPSVEIGNIAISNLNCIAPILIQVLMAIVATISFVTIFLFKKRMLQVKLSFITILLMIAYYLILTVYAYKLTENSYEYSLTVTALLPFIANIVSYLAIRAIKKDEQLVQSLNRMR